MFVGFVSVSQIIEGDQLPQVTVGHLVSHFQRPLQALVSAFEKAAAGIVLEAKGSAELKMEDEQ